MNQLDYTAERIVPSGAWRITAMIDGYRVSEQFIGYTKREAIRIFKLRHSGVPCQECV